MTDEEIRLISTPIVRRFLHQAKRLGGSRQDIMDELMNVSYVVAREHPNEKNVRTWIVWILAAYVRSQDEQVVEGRGVLVDSRRRRLEDEDEETPRMIAEVNELKEKLRVAMKDLSKEEVGIIKMYYRDGLTHEEIGEEFGKSRTWVRNRIDSVLSELRERIDRRL